MGRSGELVTNLIGEAALVQQTFERNPSGASCRGQRAGKESGRISQIPELYRLLWGN